MFACPSLSLETFFHTSCLAVVDVRSPKEYEEDHIPGAVNIPLFDNDQRAVIGTIYTQESPEKAKQVGAKFARERISEILSSFFKLLKRPLPKNYMEIFEETLHHFLHSPSPSFESEKQPLLGEDSPLVIYCWRGGMRSKAIVTLLRRLGVPAYQLEGGYRSFRKWVLQKLKTFDSPPLWVLEGLTGVGKTEVLRQIEKLFPHHTLDLEYLAQHRSSLLGDIYLKPRSQKAFESSLLFRLAKVQSSPFLVVEAEARKIGNLEIPFSLFQKMQQAPQILLEAPLEVRIQRLLKEYVKEENQALQFFRSRLPCFRKYLSPFVFSSLEKALLQKDFYRLAELLIQHYYDPRYQHTIKRKSFVLRVDTTLLSKAVQKIVHFIQESSQNGLSLFVQNSVSKK